MEHLPGHLMIVAVVVSFFICWVPFHAQRLLASYLVKQENRNQLLLDIYLKLTYISGVMYYLSSTINPLLYQLMSAKFRLAFKETFHCSLFRCAMFLRGSNSNLTTKSSLKETTTQNRHQSHQYRLSNNHDHHHNHAHHCRCHCYGHDHLNLEPLLASNSNSNLSLANNKPPSSPKPKASRPLPLSSNPNLNLASNDSNNLLYGSNYKQKCPCSKSTCYIHGTSSEQAPFCCSSTAAGVECQNHFCYLTTNNNPQTTGFNVINRLRSKLNTSLVSLFRLQSTECALCASLTTFSQTCFCCSPGDHPNGTCGQQQQRQHQHQQTDALTYNQASLPQPASVHFARCMSPTGTHNNNHPGRKESQSCSTPLLVGGQHELRKVNNNGNGSFSAHSMLKFIRTSRVTGGNNSESNQHQQQALSRLSSGEEEEKSALEAQDKMGTLIKATQDSGADEALEVNDRDLILTSESGNSSSSSPDQQQLLLQLRQQQVSENHDQQTGANERASPFQARQQQQNQLRRQKFSSCSSNGSESGSGYRNSFKNNNNNSNNVSDRNIKRRRASYHQQTEVTNQITICGKKQKQMAHNDNDIGDDFLTQQQVTRQNSSGNSSTNTKSFNKHLSSSLSSSERQLNKKLSVSTTTSAVEDCASFTTTNSQLTSGSNPTLGNFSTPQSEQLASAIEEDLPTTILNVVDKSGPSCQGHKKQALRGHDEIRAGEGGEVEDEDEEDDHDDVDEEEDDEDDEEDDDDHDEDESIADNIEMSKLPLLTKSICANNSQCHYAVESNRVTE